MKASWLCLILLTQQSRIERFISFVAQIRKRTKSPTTTHIIASRSTRVNAIVDFWQVLLTSKLCALSSSVQVPNLLCHGGQFKHPPPKRRISTGLALPFTSARHQSRRTSSQGCSAALPFSDLAPVADMKLRRELFAPILAKPRRWRWRGRRLEIFPPL